MRKTFVEHLENSLTYIRGYVASQVIFQLLENGVFEFLKEPIALNDLARRLEQDKLLLATTLEYLEREGIVAIKNAHEANPTYALTENGMMISEQRGWFEMLVGGYGSIFENLNTILKNGPKSATRNGALVGRGSCNISHYDAIPLTKKLIQSVKPEARRVVDFGCGNSLYLCTFCEELPEMTAIGVEPSKGAIEEGLKLIKQKGLENRISLVNCDAIDFEVQEEPDFIMFCFVLHELYGQYGETEVINYLSRLGRKFPNTYLLAVEVDYDLTKRDVIQSKVGLGYYNPYFLLHPLTGQQLISDKEWRRIFSAAGFDIVKSEFVDPQVDPTGLEIGYALKYRQA